MQKRLARTPRLAWRERKLKIPMQLLGGLIMDFTLSFSAQPQHVVYVLHLPPHDTPGCVYSGIAADYQIKKRREK